MGVWSNLRGLAGGSGRSAVTLVLLPSEREVLRVVGSARRGRASVGGELVLTTMRLCFQKAIDSAERSPKDADLVSVALGSGASLLKPPNVIGTGELGVLAGIWSPNLSSRNVMTRDEFVAAAARGQGLTAGDRGSARHERYLAEGPIEARAKSIC